MPAPFYPSYRNIILFSKATPVYVEGYIRECNTWRFDIERVKEAATINTKMIILSNPSNPTGVCLSKKEIFDLKVWCEQKGIYLVSDEVYDNYIYDGEFHSFTPHVSDSNRIIRNSIFSKDFAMSGWRVGYIVAPEVLVSRLIAVQDGTLCCPSVIGQHAALFALEHEHLIAEQTNAVRKNRDIAWHLLQPLVEKGIFSFVKPQAGIFFFIATTCRDSEELVMDILHEAKVALVPGKDFGTRAKNRTASSRASFTAGIAMSVMRTTTASSGSPCARSIWGPESSVDVERRPRILKSNSGRPSPMTNRAVATTALSRAKSTERRAVRLSTAPHRPQSAASPK